MTVGEGARAAGARDLSLAGKLKHSIIIFISRDPWNATVPLNKHFTSELGEWTVIVIDTDYRNLL